MYLLQIYIFIISIYFKNMDIVRLTCYKAVEAVLTFWGPCKVPVVLAEVASKCLRKYCIYRLPRLFTAWCVLSFQVVLCYDNVSLLVDRKCIHSYLTVSFSLSLIHFPFSSHAFLCFHLPPHSHAKVNGRVYLIINRWVLQFFLYFKTDVP